MSYDDYIIIDKEIKTPVVICGNCSLARNGLTYYSGKHLDLFTKYKELHNLNLAVITYYYNPNIDYTNFVRPMETNPNILLPSPERAIIECIKFIDFVSEDILLEAIQNYKLWYKSYDKLYPMADFYQVSKKDLDHWIYEAENDYEEWWEWLKI